MSQTLRRSHQNKTKNILVEELSRVFPIAQIAQHARSLEYSS